ncbi:UNVERIFIED_CONTAM: hypothetical protein K2H54_042860 [Gekko kuhli]
MATSILGEEPRFGTTPLAMLAATCNKIGNTSPLTTLRSRAPSPRAASTPGSAPPPAATGLQPVRFHGGHQPRLQRLGQRHGQQRLLPGLHLAHVVGLQ